MHLNRLIMSRPVLIITCLLLSCAALAQIKVDVQLVNVVATVTDSKGRYVTNLKASDFKLKEDGVPQDISHFSFSNDLQIGRAHV